ncbi:NAD(P)/FAD-dependent oxidoreductase [Paenibacillus jilunlii]|uniref:Pyridine nucleotide-disulfide oxidoreductase n=1 Tax=Paenibacillus jilunlii TaxID=682956 RepID=A0A1G9GCV0_9BACL|nr:NAD(P)/FAD-dependent oxidoreductase [Paenibacillus jilunlii]KWX71430.1 pyridine nucleotide-disulfide oxidoreductase [Paenibacillus jilunlii]SDK98447.1 Thioredoxin reductase [Paenibacillus jilunlii]
MSYDCAIIGGGPAGLNAALVLGRARRKVIVLDNSQSRNAVTHASHGFITRDGVTPAEFRRIAYEEVLRYPSVAHQSIQVTDVRRAGNEFSITTEDGASVTARKLLIATGLREIFPDIPGLSEHYGRSLFNCPYCDGWELRDQPLIVVSGQPGVFHMAKILYNWSKDLIVATGGEDVLTIEQRELLASRNIRIIETPVTAFIGSAGKLQHVEFADGTQLKRSGGFIAPQLQPKADFQAQLGYEVTETGGIATSEMGKSSVPGIYAAGDASYVMPSQLIYAAAQGSKAAMSINMELTEEEFAGR